MGNCQQPPSEQQKTDISKTKTRSQLIVKTLTWSRDSHGLYDYEAKTLQKKSIKTYRSGVLSRNADEIRLLKDNDKNKAAEEKELLRFVMKENHFCVAPSYEYEESTKGEGNESSDNGLWLVVKSLKANINKGYCLNEGDQIKLGRIRFRIQECQGSPPTNIQKPIKTEVENDHENSPDVSVVKLRDSMKSSQTDNVCRICLYENTEPDNPFFSPCLCSGTMKHVHIKCLQRWLKSKLHIKDSGQSISIFWKTLECELCKTGYPNSFNIAGQKYDIVEIERPNCAYLMLEIMNKDKNTPKGIHIIKMENKNNIRLGRGHDSDIRITDISVSRCHAIIKLEKGKFYLEDNNSKFGTLVNLKKPFPVTGIFNNIAMQSGRTLIQLSTKKNKTFFPACFSQSGHDSSIDEIQSDLEERRESELNVPNRNSPLRNRNLPIPGGDHFDDENIFIENLEDPIPSQGSQGSASQGNVEGSIPRINTEN